MQARTGPPMPLRGRTDQPTTRVSSIRAHRRSTWVPYGFLAPTMVAIAVGFLVPAADVVRRSFLSGSLAETGGFVGGRNYAQLMTSTEFWDSVGVTVAYALGSCAGTLLLGLASAVLLNRPFRGRALVRSAIIVPWAMPLVPAALVWQWALNYQYGVANYVLGTNTDWLTNPRLAL